MAKEKPEFVEPVKEQPTVGMGDVMKGVGEFAKEMLPGLSLSKIFQDVKVELMEQASHGSHEVASLLFRGDGYVMYPRTSKDGQSMEGQGLQQEGQQEQSQVQQQEKSRGGIER